MTPSSNPIVRPRLACEISAERVIAARVNPGQHALDVYATRRLPAGAVSPGLTAPNLLQAETVREAAGGALESVAGSHRDVLLIVPDAAVRVLLLDFDALPTGHEEAAAVIRFRARKSVPFDTDAASVAFQVDRTRVPIKVVVALSPKEVIGEYEGVIQDAGFNPGVVMSSIACTLGLVNVDQPTMVLKIDGTTTTVSIVDRNNLVLLRTLEVPGRNALSLQDVAANVLPSMVFFEDTYSAKLDRLLVTGDADLASLARSLEQETNLRVEPLPTSALGGSGFGDTLPTTLLAPVAGGLLA